MLKKRILAFQAAIVLSASMMLGVIVPAGNTAIVRAADEPRNKVYAWSMPSGEYSYDPGDIVAEYDGMNYQVATGSTIKLSVEGATSPTKNYKRRTDLKWYNVGVTIHGQRTINETATYKPEDYFISYVWDYDKQETVEKANYANYVTVDPAGNVNVIGKGKFEFRVDKRINGFSTWTVEDVYEDGFQEKQTVDSKGYQTYWDDDLSVKVDGFELKSGYFQVNTDGSASAGYRYSDGLGTKEAAIAESKWPTNSTFGIRDNTDSEIRAGESTVITLNAYKPLNEFSSLPTFSKYDSAGGKFTKIEGIRTVKESVAASKTEWTITGIEAYDKDGNYGPVAETSYSDYGEVKDGVFVGKKPCYVIVKATITGESEFTAKNAWDDGITETYKYNEAYNEGKNTKHAWTYEDTVNITVINAADDHEIYDRTIRLSDVPSEAFGSFNKEAAALKLGKGEKKSIADAWGNYKPNNDVYTKTSDSGKPYKDEYVYFDANGNRQVKRAQYTLKENNKEITHEYTSSDEKKATVDEKGNVTGGSETGHVTITDKYTVRSTFTVTYTWDDGKTQTIETGDIIDNFENTIGIEIVDAAKANQNFDVVTVNGLKYTICTDTKTAIFKAPAKKTVKKLTVPVNIKVNGENYKVVGIDNKALNGCNKLTTLTVKANITTLGTNALAGCTKLTTADLTTVKLALFPDGTFTKCKKLTKLTINGNSLMYIDEDAFKGLPKGATITIKAKSKSVYNSVVKEFKDAGYTNFKFKFKKYKK